MSKFVSESVAQSRHRWPSILAALDIYFPAGGQHGPCPVCGGKDRFRFDDKRGRGTWFCNHCGHGDGLDLVARVRRCDIAEAARVVTALASSASETPPAREKTVDPRPLAERIKALMAAASTGESPYLKARGLMTPAMLLTAAKAMTIGRVRFGEGSLLLPMFRTSGELAGAQLITPGGEKRLYPGTQLKGAFIPVNHGPEPSKLIITEGYATALTLQQCSSCHVVAAVSANNLLNVAQAFRARYPHCCLILAGDNDIHPDGAANTGKLMAEKAALAVDGWVALPPTDTACDWDDFRQRHGMEATKAAFRRQLTRPAVISPAPLPDAGPSPVTAFSSALPLRKGSEGFDTRQDYLIKGYLPSGAVASAYGASGSYKSFLAVSWACHIATGKPWANRPVTQGAVIYVVGEGGIGVPRRIRAWEETLNDRSPIDALYRVDCPVFPASPDSVEQVIKAAHDVQAATGMVVRLIILDTLARCFGGSDENAAKDMGAFIQGCDYIKAATQATVLIIHHSGKDQDKGARGSSAFRAALDVEFNVRREADGQALILTCTKMKDAEEPPRRAYDLTAVNLYVDDDGEPVTSLVLRDEGREVRDDPTDADPALSGITRLTDNHVALWEAIRSRTASGDGCTRALVRDDMRAMGFDVSKKFTRWLDKLVKDDLIALDGENIVPLSKRGNVGE
ncbi:DNA primase TraC [Dickeya dianthicola]|nr:DNA primase TraC [Dickeya dianthicola]MBI0440157.1 AAA family ATPase [Dickeya dianthicola]MBI0451123.1 AAA family ATPase [Dickeya dianthicola]MBI0455545.1 AAA family ATPase [Dickeya dianthicola]MBI0459879.1 AAA family ATPase [Dickeya dianthicola]